jgi:hypothetical protein
VNGEVTRQDTQNIPKYGDVPRKRSCIVWNTTEGTLRLRTSLETVVFEIVTIIEGRWVHKLRDGALCVQEGGRKHGVLTNSVC